MPHIEVLKTVVVEIGHGQIKYETFCRGTCMPHNPNLSNEFDINNNNKNNTWCIISKLVQNKPSINLLN